MEISSKENLQPDSKGEEPIKIELNQKERLTLKAQS